MIRPIAATAKVHGITALMLCLAGVSLLYASPRQSPENGVQRASTSVQNAASRAVPERLLSQALELRSKLTRKDLNDSVRIFHESARLFHESANPRGEALAEIELGDTYQMISAFPDALAAYRRVLTVSKSQTDQRCEAYIRMARSYANTGDSNNSRRSLDSALDACGGVPELRIQADLEEAQGETALFSDNRPAAIDHLERAIELASRSKDLDGEALATLRLAAAEPSDPSGKLQSVVHAQSALSLFLAAGNEYGAARAHSLLGFLISGSGDLERSRCHCQDALHLFERIGDPDNAAGVLNALALNARLSGDLDEALEDYQRAKRLFASAGDYIGEEASIAGISHMLLAKQGYSELTPMSSHKHALRTLSHSLMGAERIDRAAIEERANRYNEANSGYEKGFAEYQLDGNKRGEGDARMRQAVLAVNHGQLDDAIRYLSEAQKFKQETDEIADLAQIDYLRTRVFLKRHQLQEARLEIEKTISIIESQRLQIMKFDSRARYFASVHDYYSLYIQVLMRLEKANPDQGYAQIAFEASEKSKVRALLDLLGSSEEAPTCETPQAHASVSGGGEQSDQTLNTLRLVTPQALTLREVQATIGDGETALLEYALDKEQSYAWLIDGQKISGIDLGPAANIQNSVSRFRRSLLPLEPHANEPAIEYLRRRNAARDALRKESRTLSRLLLGKVQLPPRKRLLIVPDGPLQYVPFAALSAPSDGFKGKPLIMHYELSMLPSASTLVALRKTAAGRAPPADEVAIFGDPVFERPGIASGKMATAAHFNQARSLSRALQDLSGSEHIPSLPGSRSEALAIQQLFGPARTRLALGYDANREAIVGGSLARLRIIHFATHGIVDTRHPEVSGLLLSMYNRRGEYQDGYLRLSDVYKLKLSADLVVLSSCESALGKDLGSEGIIGLPRGFLYAGARRVIASLWKVDDQATVILMRSLYTRLQRGEEPAQALHGAQLDLLKNKQLSDPYYWAAFVLEGDYR